MTKRFTQANESSGQELGITTHLTTTCSCVSGQSPLEAGHVSASKFELVQTNVYHVLSLLTFRYAQNKTSYHDFPAFRETQVWGWFNNNTMLHGLLRLNISPLFHMWAVEETGRPDACLSVVSSFLPGTYWNNVLEQTTITSTQRLLIHTFPRWDIRAESCQINVCTLICI